MVSRYVNLCPFGQFAVIKIPRLTIACLYAYLPLGLCHGGGKGEQESEKNYLFHLLIDLDELPHCVEEVCETDTNGVNKGCNSLRRGSMSGGRGLRVVAFQPSPKGGGFGGAGDEGLRKTPQPYGQPIFSVGLYLLDGLNVDQLTPVDEEKAIGVKQLA